ncbi:regulator of G-protein signaling 14 isoform X2 [Thalassophryne amazonica]|uniref:regulator of G-protein signaling 14 isoform X2 n=1 Tax=Thalassophryne amazonica TaxID=390379 RepID=UPI001472409F|nr:regulator of G-protein signaling 14 isoform X2 [Thalassophryne amazonica]
MAKNCDSLGIPAGHMSQAVSDGELNMSARACSGSSCSLPATAGRDVNLANSVLTWAVSFENLLEDPSGVRYFSAFLRSEVSEENILFWQACEKFQKIPDTSLEELKAAARFIYNTYLSENAPHSINIDDSAKTDEKDLEQPSCEMFNKAQAQIFKLMKMDSYRRFVRSPLYQSCTLASVEGKCLPPLSRRAICMGSWEDVTTRSEGNKGKKLDLNNKNLMDKRRQKRGSWGEVDASQSHASVSPNGSIKSNSSVELVSLYRQMENGRARSRSPEQAGGGANWMGMDGGYCCVYLPDGSASLVPTRPQQLIKETLASLCEKRGFPLKDVIIYFYGKDKQPLSLDQDCSVLRDQQVSLELRVTFVLEITFTGKTVGIVAKSSKTLQDALSVVLQKHNLRPQDAHVTMVGSDEAVCMSSSVFRLANKTLRLEKDKGKDQTSNPRSPTEAVPGTSNMKSRLPQPTDRTQPKPSKNRDMEGFLEMLTRAQCYRVDDQRGLLTKEQLEVPLFLQVPSDQQEEDVATSSSADDGSQDNTSFTSSSARTAEEPVDSVGLEPKDTTAGKTM